MDTEQSFAKCRCRNCDGHLEFQRQHVGQTVTCPHCGQDTVLLIAGADTGKRPTPPWYRGKPAKVGLIFGGGCAACLLAVCLLAGLIFALSMRPRVVNEPQAPAKSASSKQPVEGAFGFILGEPLDQKWNTKTNEDGQITVYNDIEADKPFDFVFVSVNPERIVYEITASIEHQEAEADQVLRATLEEKYGQLSKYRLGTLGTTYVFGNTNRCVNLDGRFITYTDTALAKTERARLSAIAAETAKRNFKGL